MKVVSKKSRLKVRIIPYKNYCKINVYIHVLCLRIPLPRTYLYYFKKKRTKVFFPSLAFTISNPIFACEIHNPFPKQNPQGRGRGPRPRPWKKTVSPSPTLDSLGRLWPRSFRREFRWRMIFGTTFFGGKQTWKHVWKWETIGVFGWYFCLFVVLLELFCLLLWWWLMVACWLFVVFGIGMRRFVGEISTRRLGENWCKIDMEKTTVAILVQFWWSYHQINKQRLIIWANCYDS